MRSVLLKRSARETRHMLFRLGGIALILCMAVGTYVGIYSAIQGLYNTRDLYYQQLHMADAELRFVPEDLANLPDFSNIPGVQTWAARLLAPGQLQLADKTRYPTVVVAQPAKAAAINSLEILSGKPLDAAKPTQVLVDRNFANYHHLKVGDSFRLTMGNAQYELSVRGIALSPEYLVAPANPSFFFPIKGSMGVVYAPIEMISKRLGFTLVNSLVFRLTSGTQADKALLEQLKARAHRTRHPRGPMATSPTVECKGLSATTAQTDLHPQEERKAQSARYPHPGGPGGASPGVAGPGPGGGDAGRHRFSRLPQGALNAGRHGEVLFLAVPSAQRPVNSGGGYPGLFRRAVTSLAARSCPHPSGKVAGVAEGRVHGRGAIPSHRGRNPARGYHLPHGGQHGAGRTGKTLAGAFQGPRQGLDFLGFNFRKYHGKLLIKPAKASIAAVKEKARALCKAGKSLPQDVLIHRLNPIIRGWGEYYRHVVSKRIFADLDHAIWRMTWNWAKRRHPQRDWVFTDGSATLFRIASLLIQRHVNIRGEANPYDPAWSAYFRRRHLRQGKAKPPLPEWLIL